MKHCKKYRSLVDPNAPPHWTGAAHWERLTHTGDPLRDQVLQQRVHHRAPPGVELVAVDADVEAQPVGVGLRRHIPGGREVLFFVVAFLVVPEIQSRVGWRGGEIIYPPMTERPEVRMGTDSAKCHLVIVSHLQVSG